VTGQLAGCRVVVCRAAHQSERLLGLLRDAGADAVPLPLVAVGPPADGGAALAASVDQLGRYDWVVFTSANAVVRLLPLLRDARSFGAARVAAIGPGTAEALAAANVVADLVPERFVAESLLEAFPAAPGGGGRVLLPRAAVARDVLPDGLRAAGWDVDVVEAYRTTTAPLDPAAVEAARTADAVTFTASSTVTRFLEAAGRDAVPPLVASIGPITSATARQHGLTVDVEAEVHTIDGLVDALVRALGPG
jgi:uroporphyrinogen-III synthase